MIDFAGSDDPAADLDERIEMLTVSIRNGIKGVVSDAIRSNQNWLEDLWAGVNKDDKIGDVVWTFNASEIIKKNNRIDLNQRWENNGDWEIFGNITTSEVSDKEPMKPIVNCKEIARKLRFAQQSLTISRSGLNTAPPSEKRLIIMLIRRTLNEINALEAQYQQLGCSEKQVLPEDKELSIKLKHKII